MQVLKDAITPLLSSAGPLQDTLKWVVIGGSMETARRMSMSAWNGFIDSFFLTAHFSQEDYPYDWLMHWLSKQPAWGHSREFEITTRSVTRGLVQSTSGDLEEDEQEEEVEEPLVHGRRKRKVAFMPSLDTTHTIYYRGHWLRITRARRVNEYGHCNELKVSVIARNNSILKKLVLEAKRDYEKDAEHRVHIFMADGYGGWRWNGARQKRPMTSIVLEPGVKDMILADCKDFLQSEEWYAERGIPFRRGYLLHGVPGSGKTSLIHSLAGELGLDIYVISLSSKGMSDNTLSSLMGGVPSRCIVLLEDLDAAFTRSVSRDKSSTGVPTTKTTTTSSSSSSSTDSDGSTLSLSGLLNSLDGVAAAEGRLLFATTNHIERLDPALSRPGRMDVWINFANATRWQAEGIFKCFFPTKSSQPLDKSNTDAQDRIAQSKRKEKARVIPILEESEINELAKRFAANVPEGEMSVASLQGYLLRNKTRPRECVDEVAEWVIKERELKAKLKKEKEEREAQEKKEAEEQAAKEAKEKADSEKKSTTEDKTTEEKTSKSDSESAKVAEASTAVSPSSSQELEKPGSVVATTEKADTVAKTESPNSSSEAVVPNSDSEVNTTDEAADDADESDMTTDEEKEIGQVVDAATTAEPASKDGKWVNVKDAKQMASTSN